MAKFLKVTNEVLNMNLQDITFDNPAVAKLRGGSSAETTLLRTMKHHNKTLMVWTLRKDGVYVREEFVEAYNLVQE
jgi:hypothetical protein